MPNQKRPTRRLFKPYSLVPDTILEVLRTAKRPLYGPEVYDRVYARIGNHLDRVEQENARGRVSGNLVHLENAGLIRAFHNKRGKRFSEGMGARPAHMVYKAV